MLLATAPGFAGTVYPVSARLALAPRQEQHCLKAIVENKDDCRVVALANVAFSAAVARMFTAAIPPNLQLVLVVTDANVFINAAGGAEFDLRTRVRILTADGKPLDEIASQGSAAFLEPTAVDDAAEAAAGNAARSFEVGYARSAAVRDWLVQSRIAPAAAVSLPERSDKLVFASGGGSLVQGGGDGDVAPALSLRVGGTFGRYLLQALYSRFTASFQGVVAGGQGTTSPARLRVQDLGIEAGASFRLRPALELRAGPGLHYLSASGGLENGGSVETSVSSSTKLSPTLFASLSTTFLPFRSGARFSAGLEARAYFFSTVDQRAAGRTVPAANASLGLTFGVEYPWANGTAR